MNQTRPNETENYIPTRWLLPLRIAWVLLAVFLFAIYFVGLEPQYNGLQQICQTEECRVLTINPDEFQIIQKFGLTMESYALAQMLLEGYLVVIISVLAIFVFWLRSDTWIGYIVSLALLFLALIFFAEESRTVAGLYPDLLWAADVLTSIAVGLLMLLIYLFPDGRFVPRWLRWAASAMIIILLLDPFLNRSGQRTFSGTMVVIVIFLIGALLGLFSQVYRYRKISTPSQRQQTKWVLFGFLSMFVGMMIWAIFAEIAPLSPGVPRLIFYLSLVPQYILVGIFPITVVFSMMRYRLWDIDLVIRRTLQYTVLTGLLVLTYFGVVVILQGIISPLTGSTNAPIITVITTLFIAALFNPLRPRVQNFIDRRFYRKKYDAQQVLNQFAKTVRDEVDMEELTAEMVLVVEETIQPESVTIWLRQARGRKSV